MTHTNTTNTTNTIVGIPLNPLLRPLRLINATSHSQKPEQWEPLGIEFLNPEKPIWSEISPSLSLKEQVLAAWRVLLNVMDTNLALGRDWNGVALGGYAPLVVPFFHLLSKARHATFAFVQGPTITIDGKQRSGPMEGARLCKPPKAMRDPELSMEPAKKRKLVLDNFRKDKMLWLSNRPLTPLRRGELAPILSGVSLEEVFPINPPFLGGDMDSFLERAQEVIELARRERLPFLFDGPPAETMFLLSALADDVPFYFVRTQKSGESPIPTPIGIEKIPSF